MERLMEDVLNIKNVLPWIECDEDVINFMRKIPLDKSYLRIQLTLKHLLNKKDCRCDGFEKEIEDDAREIVVILPDISYKEIKEKLSILGNIQNRKEVVLRQLLHKKHDLDEDLREINVTPRKRKSESSKAILDLDSGNSQTNINIKIRRIDGSLEVVSRISSQEQPSTSTKNTNTHENTEEATTSSTSVTSSTNQSSNGSPDSTVQTTTEAEDPYPDFTTISNNLGETSNLPTSEPVMSTKTSRVPLVSNNNIGYGKTSKVDNRNEIIEILSPTGEAPKGEPDTPHNFGSIGANVSEPYFDLVAFVKELSSASEHKISQLCERMGLNLNEKPSESKLTALLNRVFDDIVEVESPGSSNTADSDNQDDSDVDMIPPVLPSAPSVCKSVTEKSKQGKEKFSLKPAVLNVGFLDKPSYSSKPRSPSPARSNIPLQSSLPKSRSQIPIIQPPRFIPTRSIVEKVVENDGPVINHEPMPSTSGTTDNVQFNDNDEETAEEEAALNLSFNADDVDMQVDEPVAGPSTIKQPEVRVLDQNLVLRLIEMFPEACPEYIRDVCNGKQWSDLDSVVTVILSAHNYPKRPERVPSPPKEVDPDEQFEIIKELLPDADPTYLRIQCEKFSNNDKGLKEFINAAMERKDYPTMKEYLRKQQLSAQQKQYTTEFNIENFIQLFPDPKKTFEDPNRTVKTDSYASHYLTTFFKNRYDRISVKYIQNMLYSNKYKVLVCDQVFRNMVMRNEVMKSRRKPTPLPENLQNIPLLQELAYLTHQEEIEAYLREQKKKEEQERIEAKENGLMETCQCCYDEEVMPKDSFCCPSGCKFCRDCVKKSCEVALGDGKTDFPCLAACSNELSLQTLQDALPPKMFSKLAQKKALAEIKAAGIEELETCPFCDFASIPNEADKIFRCLNPDCMQESCRKCKEPNHVPLKCEEVEKDQDVKARTYIENKMTEALIRKCWKCGTSFFKEEGCNKMTCSCGARMCYICQKPVTDYSHFNGIGGDKHHLCPLYSDTNKINQQNVLGAAAAAKAEIDPNNLKVDPTVGITDHFNNRAKKLPREAHLEVLQRVNNLHHRHRHRHRHHPQIQHMVQQRQHYLQVLIEQEWQMQD